MELTKKQLEDIGEFIKKIQERPSMFITSSEINMLKNYIQMIDGRSIATGCATCLRNELLWLRDYIFNHLTEIEQKKVHNPKVEIKKIKLKGEEDEGTDNQ